MKLLWEAKLHLIFGFFGGLSLWAIWSLANSSENDGSSMAMFMIFIGGLLVVLLIRDFNGARAYKFIEVLATRDVVQNLLEERARKFNIACVNDAALKHELARLSREPTKQECSDLKRSVLFLQYAKRRFWELYSLVKQFAPNKLSETQLRSGVSFKEFLPKESNDQAA